ncbi:MAG: TolC family protein [Archangiaceae bacterium]|nr:TolC family protein [Archangiaceae bacterium]
MRCRLSSAVKAVLVSSVAWAGPPVPPAPAAAPDAVVSTRRVVTLSEALKLANSNNHDYQAALANAQMVQVQTQRVWGAILPEIVFNGSLVHTSNATVLDMSGFIGAIGFAYNLGQPAPGSVPPPYVIAAQNSAYATLQVQQFLFTPMMFLLPAAKPGAAAAKLGAAEAREQVLLGVARLYLGLQGLQQIEAAARDAESVALKREHDAMGQVAAGTQGEISLLRAQTETAQARGTLAQLAGTREGLLSTLESLVGEAVRPDETVAGLPNWHPSDESSKPWEQLFIVQATAKGAEAQEKFVTYDSLMFLPTVVATAKGNYNSNTGFVGTNWTYDFSVGLNFPLYDRGNRYSLKHEDEAKLRAAREKLESERAKAKSGWATARANLQAAEVALEQAEAQATLAAKAQKQLDGAFQLGLATALELSDIDNKRFFAASQVAQVRAQLEVRKVEMLAAEGRLARAAGLEE